MSLIHFLSKGGLPSYQYGRQIFEPRYALQQVREPLVVAHATKMRIVADFNFVVMLDAKSKDLAFVRLRSDLFQYAPAVTFRLPS